MGHDDNNVRYRLQLSGITIVFSIVRPLENSSRIGSISCDVMPAEQQQSERTLQFYPRVHSCQFINVTVVLSQRAAVNAEAFRVVEFRFLRPPVNRPSRPRLPACNK